MKENPCRRPLEMIYWFMQPNPNVLGSRVWHCCFVFLASSRFWLLNVFSFFCVLDHLFRFHSHYLVKAIFETFDIVLRFNNNVHTVQITILVAAEGVYKLPAINSSMDLKEALQKLGSIPSSKTMVIILYTSTYWSFVLMPN